MIKNLQTTIFVSKLKLMPQSKMKVTNEFFENAVRDRVFTKERLTLLNNIAEEITRVYKQNGLVNLNFICTHNSRRSQFGQVWAFYAADYFNLNIHSFSGGTEVTAFHRNTVKTLKEVGFTFNLQDFSHQNPVYQISFSDTDQYILGFSKLYDNEVNQSPFIAITTCNSADTNCPFISEASKRFHLPFVDPKHSDDTAQVAKVYLETNKEIASEVFTIFTKVKELI